ncbi:MAG TPA: sigma-70 family RNA polymerase sigma factor [Candidatus Eisenbacteria bacterium]
MVRCLPAWPEKLIQLAHALQGPDGVLARNEFWYLLNLALLQHLRFQGPRLGLTDDDRLHDLASEKASNLVGKFDRGSWRPQDSSAGELVNFVKTIARNALVDEHRRPRPREVALEEHMADSGVAPRAVEQPIDTIGRDRFVDRLIRCAGNLKPEHRRIWLLRVLYDMPSRAIAAHPDVQLTPGNVDVILARAREQIRNGMGVDPGARHQLPQGTLSALWEHYRQPADDPGRVGDGNE